MCLYHYMFIGILQRLDHFKYIGVEAIWLSPIYTSPMVDFGYDVANFTAIDPMFGTMLDFEELVEEAHAKGGYYRVGIVKCGYNRGCRQS